MNGIAKARVFFRRLPFVCISILIIAFSATDIVAAENLGLLDAPALRQKLSKWVVLDARPRAEWLEAHIPGALSFSWEDYTRTDEKGVPYRIWSAGELAAALGKMGVSEKTPVVVYGDADKSWGGEGWSCWALSWLGHKGPIRLLTGGIQAWKQNGLPLVSGAEAPKNRPVGYRHIPQPALDITTKELREKKSSLVLIDTRSTLEWFGGRIPGAIHINWEKFYTGADRRPISPDRFKKLLREHNISANAPIVYYCTGGVRSAYAWMVHQLSGLPASRNYEGGFEAWRRMSH